MKSDNYWANRANQRMDDYILQSEETANEIAQAYYSASKRIENEMVRVVKGLGAISDDATALKYLKNPQSGSVIRTIKAAVNRMPDGPEKQEALTLISSPAYLFRMRRLQATIDNARKECNKLYKAELKETTAHLKSLYSDAFSHTIYDIDKGYNTLHTFSMFPASRVSKLLKSRWSGENYSGRIWSSTQDLADTLKEEMLIAFMTGASVSETSRRLAEKFQTSAYQARRLVRTESNFIANQAEQDAYKRLGIEEYKYIATLDTRTSTICQSLDGRVFNVEDGKAGVNLPPMHPNCRSTTIMYDADIPLRSRAARDENGKRITVPGDTKYDDWLKEYHPELINYARSGNDNKMFYIIPSLKGEILRAPNIYRDLQKSEIGREAYEYIEKNNIPVEITYDDNVPENERGYSTPSRIYVFAKNTKSAKVTAETIIHEVTHMKYKIGGSQWAEAQCFAAEKLHEKETLTISDKRDIIKEVKKLYHELKWR